MAAQLTDQQPADNITACVPTADERDAAILLPPGDLRLDSEGACDNGIHLFANTHAMF